MNKKIITIAEIVFALIFVVLLAVFMATINSKGNSANNQLVNTLEATDGTSLTNYDGTTVKGSTVATALGNYKSIGGDLKLTLLVQTNEGESEDSDAPYWGQIVGATGDGASSEGYHYGYADGNEDDAEPGDELPVYSATADDAWYINQSANFKCTLIKNSNDVVIGIHFAQQ